MGQKIEAGRDEGLIWLAWWTRGWRPYRRELLQQGNLRATWSDGCQVWLKPTGGQGKTLSWAAKRTEEMDRREERGHWGGYPDRRRTRSSMAADKGVRRQCLSGSRIPVAARLRGEASAARTQVTRLRDRRGGAFTLLSYRLGEKERLREGIGTFSRIKIGFRDSSP